MKTKYVTKRLIVPSLSMDFNIYAKRADQEQFDLLWNLLFSTWVKNAPQGAVLEVYDYLGALKGENDSKGSST